MRKINKIMKIWESGEGKSDKSLYNVNYIRSWEEILKKK